MKKRPRRGNSKDVTPDRADAPKSLQYKVIELSTVDEGAIERTLNEWVSKGWHFDGVQFAMRESSKRPAMAFVFFTKEGEPIRDQTDDDQAKARLHRLATAEHATASITPISARERLAQLAGEDEDDGL